MQPSNFGAIVLALLAVLPAGQPALAQRGQQQPQPQAQASPPAPAPQPPAAAQTPSWESFPTMQLERVYRGPLRDTVIQRWRDTVDGSVCFLYIPISAPLVAQQAPNPPYVQYGPNVIGSISCSHPTQVVQLVQPPRAEAATRPPKR